MKTKIESIWDEITDGSTTRPIADGSFLLRRIDLDSRLDIYAGVDGSGFVMLAIGVMRPPPAIDMESSSIDYFRQQRLDGTWLMALRLRGKVLAGVFGRLCQDLVDATATVGNEAELVALVRDRLNLWKRLFEHGESGLLEPHEIKGLIAELLVLEEFLIAGTRSTLEAVTAWVGPLGADQDFVFSDEAVEVKAVGPNAEGVSISSLQQLLAPTALTLRISTMRAASPGENGSLDLNKMALRIEGRLAAFPEALTLFRRRLLEARYVEDPRYNAVSFQQIGAEAFAVTDAFPKLTMAVVPDGVISATYVLALDKIRNPD